MTDIYYQQQLTSIEKIGLFAVIFRIIWTPLQVWSLHFDGAGRLSFCFLLFAFILLFHEIKQYSWEKPLTIYTVLAAYMIFNGLLKGSAAMYEKDGIWLMITHLSSPILSMLIIALCARINFNITLKWLSWGLLLYCLLCFIFSTIDDEGRLNAEINANEIALHAAIGFGLFLLAFLQEEKKTLTIIALIFLAFTIILTGSRMGLAMVSIMCIFFIVIKYDLRDSNKLFGALIVFIAFISISFYIMDNTLIGERMLGTTTDYEKMTIKTGTILDYYGDRGAQYFFSWPVFLKHPITGIGFNQWIKYSPSKLVCHSEYMVQYVECGLIAFSLFIWFWYLMLWNIIKSIKSSGTHKDVLKMLLAFLFAIIFSNSVLWSYNMICVFVVYALAFAYMKNVEDEEECIYIGDV